MHIRSDFHIHMRIKPLLFFRPRVSQSVPRAERNIMATEVYSSRFCPRSPLCFKLGLSRISLDPHHRVNGFFCLKQTCLQTILLNLLVVTAYSLVGFVRVRRLPTNARSCLASSKNFTKHSKTMHPN